MPLPPLHRHARRACLVFFACALAGCSDSSATAKKGNDEGSAIPDSERAPLVRVETVVRRSVQRKIETTSYLEARHSVVVLPRVSGRVDEVFIDEGQPVKKGQVLARLDDREIRATLKQMEVQLADKKLRHELAKLEEEATQHRERQATFEYDKATNDLARLTNLDPELVSPRDLDDAKHLQDTSESALKVAGFLTRKAKLDVQTANQAIEDAKSKKVAAEIQLAEHEILAPISGVISRRMVRGGEAIGPTTELFEVIDTAHLIAYLDRPQRELGLVRNAKQIVFTSEAHLGREFHADIDVISPYVEQGTGSFKIRVKVRQDEVALLLPGLFIRAKILTEEGREAIMIPKTAVLADGDDSVIFFVRDPLEGKGKARRLRLETGIEEDMSIECRNTGAQSLRPGDLIIVSGQQELKDQTEVEISKN